MTKQEINALDLKLKELKRARCCLNDDKMAVVLCDIVDLCTIIGFRNNFNLNVIMTARREKERQQQADKAKKAKDESDKKDNEGDEDDECYQTTQRSEGGH
jgi:hypothetical protein